LLARRQRRSTGLADPTRPVRRAGPDRTGPDRTGPDRTAPHRTGPDRTGPHRHPSFPRPLRHSRAGGNPGAAVLNMPRRSGSPNPARATMCFPITRSIHHAHIRHSRAHLRHSRAGGNPGTAVLNMPRRRRRTQNTMRNTWRNIRTVSSRTHACTCRTGFPPARE
jgi:hypothetical protein